MDQESNWLIKINNILNCSPKHFCTWICVKAKTYCIYFGFWLLTFFFIRASIIRNHNNNSLSTPPHPYRYGTSKSSESDLSTCTLSGSRLPLPQSPRRPSSSPGGPHSAHSRLFRPQTSHLRPPPTPDSPHHYHGFNGFHGNTSPTASHSSVSSPGAMSVGSAVCSLSGGELVPVALGRTEGDQGLGFSVTAGGPGGRMTIVKRVWDRKQCNSLQPGDAIVKINGADVQSLSFTQVLEDQMGGKSGEVLWTKHNS